ncbi:nuclear pore complex protein NUP1 isoform X2 [Carica papaya]|uniref:nuclear pore complex protein NUP1 isoform X2 n=1 Tax=Carica papaya TaxID=3649 RepID=UPI000B8CF79A|nr:nuclear pore complex protein NUP1 isoform X2 [Carica papaya]
MATAREEANPYDGGLGAGGKFRKRPFRRGQSTPYDRPPTGLRNPSNSNRNNGWLSKLMDPAQRLITSSAHRLFASVFRKQLPPPPPPQPPETEANAKMTAEDHQQDSPNPSIIKEGDSNVCDNPCNSSDGDGFIELEQILRQKTFTRSEINRLTSLLHSRTIDASYGNEEKISEVIPLKSLASKERKEELPNTPIRENGTQGHLISTPFISSSVLDEDIASPAELAKAYMGSRPSKVSPSMAGISSQSEASNMFGNRIPPKTPIMSLVPRSSSRVQVSENGFTTPRYRGRSALYNMARTPYSRDGLTATTRGARPTGEVFGRLSSSSQSTWEKNRVSGSKQGTLKRGSSVLENDIGSVGPIRRIRQKAGLLSPKHLSLAVSGRPPSVDAIGIDFNAEHNSLSTKKLLTADHCFAKTSADNAESSIRSTSLTPVPSKSSEMAAKILQQLDKLVSSKDKSPSKLSPSMLRGPALRSLENVDSSKFLVNLQDDMKSSAPLDILPPNTWELTSQKQDVIEENARENFSISNNKSGSVVNGAVITGFTKAVVPSATATGSPGVNSCMDPPSQSKRAFRMSAHEDYVELDDDEYSNKAVSAPLAVSPLSEIKPLASSTFNNKVENEASDQNLNAGRSTEIVSLPASGGIAVQQSVVVTESPPIGTPTSEKESSAAPAISSFGEKIPLFGDLKVGSSTFILAQKMLMRLNSLLMPLHLQLLVNLWVQNLVFRQIQTQQNQAAF